VHACVCACNHTCTHAHVHTQNSPPYPFPPPHSTLQCLHCSSRSVSQRAGAIAPAIAILIGFKDKHAATMAPMELARLHCRCAGLFQLYTDNRINLRDHLCAALHALDKHKGAAASDIRGCFFCFTIPTRWVDTQIPSPHFCVFRWLLLFHLFVKHLSLFS